MFKRYVPVIVRFNEEGELQPLVIEYDTGQKYVIDKVLGPPVRAACQSVGGVGAVYRRNWWSGNLYLVGKGKMVHRRQAQY